MKSLAQPPNTPAPKRGLALLEALPELQRRQLVAWLTDPGRITYSEICELLWLDFRVRTNSAALQRFFEKNFAAQLRSTRRLPSPYIIEIVTSILHGGRIVAREVEVKPFKSAGTITRKDVIARLTRKK